MGNWIQKASERMERKGTKGTFSARAKLEGKSSKQLAREILSGNHNLSDNPKWVKRANFARNVGKKRKTISEAREMSLIYPSLTKQQERIVRKHARKNPEINKIATNPVRRTLNVVTAADTAYGGLVGATAGGAASLSIMRNIPSNLSRRADKLAFGAIVGAPLVGGALGVAYKRYQHKYGGLSVDPAIIMHAQDRGGKKALRKIYKLGLEKKPQRKHNRNVAKKGLNRSDWLENKEDVMVTREDLIEAIIDVLVEEEEPKKFGKKGRVKRGLGLYAGATLGGTSAHLGHLGFSSKARGNALAAMGKTVQAMKAVIRKDPSAMMKPSFAFKVANRAMKNKRFWKHIMLGGGAATLAGQIGGVAAIRALQKRKLRKGGYDK